MNIQSECIVISADSSITVSQKEKAMNIQSECIVISADSSITVSHSLASLKSGATIDSLCVCLGSLNLPVFVVSCTP